MERRSVNGEKKEKFWTIQPELSSFRVIDYENVWREKHISANNELLYVLDGKCTLEIGEGLAYPAVAGDFLLIPRHVLHRDVFEPLRGLRIMMISFTWQEADLFFNTVNNVELHRLDFATRSEVRRRLDFLYELWSKKLISTPNAQVQLHALLLLFYCSIVHAAKAKEQINTNLGHSKLIQQAKFFITQNYASEITLEQTSVKLGISPSYLSRLFQREFGVSFSTYLTTIRLENAVSLLHHTALQIAEIAYRCGFKDSSYFIKIFRQHYGKTPGNFRT
ncbi:MAG: helix-turn-helix transcriptional regulator [Lentisphaeria bacterium]|nr:helix-turn-helix transcriptional regulator [Lentisphaeria bacterium]